MDALDILKFGASQASTYAAVFVSTLLRPSRTLTSAPSAAEKSAGYDLELVGELRVPSAYLPFLALSVMLGALIWQAIPNPINPRPSSEVVVLLFIVLSWMLFSLIIYGVQWALGGKVSARSVLLLSCHVLAVMYVLAAVAAFLVTTVSITFFSPSTYDQTVMPVMVFGSVHACLVTAYVPLALGSHLRVRGWRLVTFVLLSGILAAAFAVLGTAMEGLLHIPAFG
jgi:hypothetical protein